MLTFKQIEVATTGNYYFTTDYNDGDFYLVIPVDDEWEAQWKGRPLGRTSSKKYAKLLCEKHDNDRKLPAEKAKEKFINSITPRRLADD
jgi:hypothetical protein